jgi:Helicase conserved C-terminal domain
MTTLLLSHQLEALGKMHNGCILKGAPGTGKTITALAYYDDNESVERLIVITTAKKRDTGDWQAEARLLGIFPEVDSWQNIDKYEDVKGAFFIFDEQRVVGSGPWVKSFLRITKHNQWVLLSATPGDTWQDYVPVFIANGWYRNRTEFLREHAIWNRYARYPKVDRWTGEAKLQKILSSILIEMPFGSHTIRHEADVFCEYDREQYDTVWRRRWNVAENRPIRHISELFALLRRTVNKDPSRLDNVRKLLVEHPRAIIFYNFDYELEILRTLDTQIAEWNGHKHEKIPGGDEWAYLVQYAAGSEGWNCTETDTVIFYSLTYSYRMFEQAKGRTDRLNTKYRNLYYFVLRSASKIDAGIYQALTQKRNFNEKIFLRTMG